ncbi:lysophospholipid acyltransferase family protein [Gordonia sinesedis]
MSAMALPVGAESLLDPPPALGLRIAAPAPPASAGVATDAVGHPARHAWYPTSPCGDACHTGDVADTAPAGAVLVVARLLRLLWIALVVLAAGVAVTPLPRLVRRSYLRWASRALLRAIGVEMAVDDRRPFASNGRGLVVANHISYLDILAVAAITPAYFVAKSDVASIPGIAVLARRLGVITIDRESLRSLPGTLDRAVDGLHGDASVAVFPEGTTWCGRGRGAFRPAFFQAAIDAGVPILPIGLGFTVDGRLSTVPGFIGDDGPADTLRRVIGTRGLTVHVCVHEPQLPISDRRTLAARCEELIGRHPVSGIPAPAHR